VSKTNYRKTLQAARAEFDRLIQERLKLDARIVNLKQTIAGLMGLCDVDRNAQRTLSNIVPLSPHFMRLTSAIRQVLAEADSGLRPPQLRDRLFGHGLNMTHYANKLGTIHNTLNRLERQGEVTKVDSGWILTEKGALASRIDSLDFTFSAPFEAQVESVPANGKDESAAISKIQRRKARSVSNGS